MAYWLKFGKMEANKEKTILYFSNFGPSFVLTSIFNQGSE